ncbi:MAG: DUF1549 domain-containing protein [Acidobacteria bacterium]|nr:DUF1549 domain-containing protein [Acidobacteriota bacterium]
MASFEQLEGQNIKPASPAGKETLLRRATFDLTGMPPTEAEIRDFPCRQLTRRIQESCREAARFAEVRREMGAKAGWMLPLRRFNRQRRGPQVSLCLEIPRLRDRIVQQGSPYDQFVRRTDCRRYAAPAKF